MKRLISTKDLSHEDWLRSRKQGIGGSDIAAICGLSPFKSPLSVYFDKVSDAVEVVDNERMRIGRDLEDYVARRFEEETGKKVRRNNYILQHDDYPFLLANIDREIVGENAILECKTTNSFAKKSWEDGIPDYYALQVHHYISVMDLDRAYLAVLIGNECFRYYTIERDEEIIKNLIAISEDFWKNHVEKQIEPPPDGSSEYTKRLASRYDAIDNTIDLSSQDNRDKIARLATINDLEKELNQEKEQIKQELMLQMQDNEIAFVGAKKITWKWQQRTNVQGKELKKDFPDIYEKYSKTSSTRVFKI